MSEKEECYCRLCAEPTPKTGLISSEDDVAINSKITAKMLWINIDISLSNTLPTSICFSCFDLLERTWAFLNGVRTAQQKLLEIFHKKDDIQISQNETKLPDSNSAGKPVDKNWDEFQETKKYVQIEVPGQSLATITTVDPKSLLNEPNNIVKVEQVSDDTSDGNNTDDCSNSSDSDLPLRRTVRKKKVKKKLKHKFDTEISENELVMKAEAESMEVTPLNLSWEDHTCRCGLCDALLKNIESLRLHSLQIHMQCCVFKCSDCDKVLSNHKSYINHARLHKKLLRHYCEFCNKRFVMSSNVKRHRSTIHKNVFVMSCPTCGMSFDSQELLEDHMLVYSKNYKKEYGRSERKQRRNGKSELKCHDCNREFKSRSNLTQHQLVHTQRSRDFSCHVCGKMFFTKGTLSTHMATHEDTRPFKCEYCPMAFRARGNLKSHISLHSGAKPFVCEQCGKSFRAKRHLKSHSIVHTDLMPYVCPHCNKTFRFKTRLNLHLRQHTGAKPYTCVFCQRDFTNGSNYKKHMKRRHNIDTSKKKYNNIVNENEQENTNEADTKF